MPYQHQFPAVFHSRQHRIRINTCKPRVDKAEKDIEQQTPVGQTCSPSYDPCLLLCAHITHNTAKAHTQNRSHSGDEQATLYDKDVLSVINLQTIRKCLV